jgi:hypothetical protein
MKSEELLANYSCLFASKMIETIQNRKTQLVTYCVTFNLRSRNVPDYSDVHYEQFQIVTFLGSYFIKQSTKDLFYARLFYVFLLSHPLQIYTT